MSLVNVKNGDVLFSKKNNCKVTVSSVLADGSVDIAWFIGADAYNECVAITDLSVASTGKTGLELIADERARQITEEGFTTEHDKQHDNGQLAAAAASYALWNWSQTDAERLF